MRRGGNSGIVVASVALAGAALLFGAAVSRAMLRTPVTAAPAPEAAPRAEAPAAKPAAAVRTASEDVPGEVLSLAVERAPFDPDRRAPEQRYLMPGERVVRPVVREERPEPPPAPEFRVLGTIAGPNGGVAVVQVEDEAPRVVAMGTEILGYRVASIDGGRVVMSGQGRNLALEVPDALPNGTASVNNNQRGQQGRGGQQGGRGNQGNQNSRNQNQQREAERAQQQVRERMEQIMEQVGGGGRYEVQGDRVFITTPNGQRREVQIPDNAGRIQVSPQGNITFQRGRGAGGGGD